MPRVIEIDHSQILSWRNDSLKWCYIYRRLGISRSFMLRWRRNTGFVDPIRNVEIDELVEIIRSFTPTNPFSGETMLRGYLRSNKLYASRNTIREAINIVGPEGREMRIRLLYRVPYIMVEHPAGCNMQTLLMN